MRRAVFLLLAVAALTAGCRQPASETARELPVQRMTGPAAANSTAPHLARSPADEIVLSWMEHDRGTARLKFSVLRNNAWSAASTVASGKNWFVNWADFPSVEPLHDNLWAAHWLVRSGPDTYAYDIAMALSSDAGKTWSEPFSPHRDGTQTEHGFVSLMPAPNGVTAVWLDGRNMIAGEDHATGHGDGAMTLRSATFTATGELMSDALLDEKVCDCCQTDSSFGAAGPLVVYRDRSDDEIRDISLLRLQDKQWTKPSALSHDQWTISGCPVNGPAIATNGNHSGVAWFTGADDKGRVKFIALDANAETRFGPLTIDDREPLGRVDVVMLANGDAIVSWLHAGTDGGELLVRRVLSTGPVGPIRKIAAVDTSRKSGFPQMQRTETDLILSWTDTTGDEPVVRTARVAITAI